MLQVLVLLREENFPFQSIKLNIFSLRLLISDGKEL